MCMVDGIGIGTCLRKVCVVKVSVCTPVSIKKAFACECMGGSSFVRVSYVPGM